MQVDFRDFQNYKTSKFLSISCELIYASALARSKRFSLGKLARLKERKAVFGQHGLKTLCSKIRHSRQRICRF